MQAERGDWLIIERASVDQSSRKGLILEVRSVDGSPLYRVRWGGNGYTSLIVPGPDARIVKAANSRSRGTSKKRTSVRRWLRRRQ